MTTEVAPSPVLNQREGGVLTLTLNRPHVLNAITDELLDGITAGLGEARDDDAVRAVLITGAGRGFCSGQDLRYAAEKGGIDVEAALRDHYHPVLVGMRTLEKPVIAAINGVAAGAGFSLALAADLRIAAQSATFVQAFVRIGLIPDAGSTWFLPRLVGPARAAELMMLGETFDSARAEQLGIVSRVVPDTLLMTEAMAIASRLSKGPRSVALIKRALNQSLDNDLETQLGVEEKLQAEATTTSDFMEGIGAFLTKRDANFTGH